MYIDPFGIISGLIILFNQPERQLNIPPLTETAYHQSILYDLLDKDNEEYKKFYHLIDIESSWDKNAENPKTKAVGYFQIIDYWWLDRAKELGLDDYRTNPISNLKMGMVVYKEQGMSAWEPSLKKLEEKLGYSI